MDILLFRHGQKDLTPFDDPHLTAEGFRQADNIAELVLKKLLPAPTELWVSEIIRTHQTLAALSKMLNIPTVKKPELNLREDGELRHSFQKRVHKLIEQLSVSAGKSSVSSCMYLCTHYDWIEEAMALIPSDTDLSTFEFAHWAPAHYVQFKIEAGLWKVVQKAKPR